MHSASLGLSCGMQDLLLRPAGSFVAACRIFVAACRIFCSVLQDLCCGAQTLVVSWVLQSTRASVAVVLRLSCTKACGILVPDQQLNPCLLHPRWILNHWATREVSGLIVFESFHSLPPVRPNNPRKTLQALYSIPFQCVPGS